MTPKKQTQHALEKRYQMEGRRILDLIMAHKRLGVAMAGAVAEFHLEESLLAHPQIVSVVAIDQDGEPDFDVVFLSGETRRIECKNVSNARVDKDGNPKVELRKTRSAKNNPTGSCYKQDKFDIIAACLFSQTGKWEFRFISTSNCATHVLHPEYLLSNLVVDSAWSENIIDCL